MAAAAVQVEVVQVGTKPIEGQKPGTSGLRKKTAVFEHTEHYLENFIQATFNALEEAGQPVAGTTLVAAADGR